jgi:serine/threonine-protein kinase
MTDSPSTTPGADLVGRVLSSRYRIIKKLGEGAMGDVYVGEHLTIGRRDAIKVLRPALAQDAEAIARFTRGTRNVSAIRHPNVCTIYDFSDTPEGVRFLAMEYIEGETLKELLDREGRLEVRRAAGIARQVADALQAAHEVGVVHRDLKPGNIMMCRRPDGRDLVKVVDFDIAKGPAEAEGEEVTRMGFVVGTPEYMSPEQLTGDRLDGRSDIYSLGIVLFRMLAGQLPFRATSTQEIMIQRLTGAPMRLDEALPGAPAALQRVLERALARRPADRQASAAEFADELEAALAGAGAPTAPHPLDPALAPHGVAGGIGATTVIPPSTGGYGELPPTRVGPSISVPPTERQRRVNPLVLGGVAALLIVAVAGAAVLLKGGGDDPAAATDRLPPAQVAGPESGVSGTPVTAKPGTEEPAAPAAGQSPGPSGGREPASSPGQDPVSPTRPDPVPATPAVTFPGGISRMLDRQLELLLGEPSPATLRAVRDSGQQAWRVAETREDSATAALVLAQAALAARDDAECARWARTGSALRAAGFEMLLQVCR